MARVDLEAVKRAFSACTWGNTNDTPQDSLRLLFDRESIARYALAMNKPLHRSFAERRRKVWRYLYCGIKEPIPELDWIIHKRTDHSQDVSEISSRTEWSASDYLESSNPLSGRPVVDGRL